MSKKGAYGYITISELIESLELKVYTMIANTPTIETETIFLTEVPDEIYELFLGNKKGN